jgi:hypothetical protein
LEAYKYFSIHKIYYDFMVTKRNSNEARSLIREAGHIIYMMKTLNKESNVRNMLRTAGTTIGAIYVVGFEAIATYSASYGTYQLLNNGDMNHGVKGLVCSTILGTCTAASVGLLAHSLLNKARNQDY